MWVPPPVAAIAGAIAGEKKKKRPTHAELRRVADKLLAAYSDVEFYRRHGPEHGIDNHDEKLAAAHREYRERREELDAVLV